jgi:hypothetical protein
MAKLSSVCLRRVYGPSSAPRFRGRPRSRVVADLLTGVTVRKAPTDRLSGHARLAFGPQNGIEGRRSPMGSARSSRTRQEEPKTALNAI